MAEKEKEKLINIFDKEYKESDLSDEQKAMVNHIDDLSRKIGASDESEIKDLRIKKANKDVIEIKLEVMSSDISEIKEMLRDLK